MAPEAPAAHQAARRGRPRVAAGSGEGLPPPQRDRLTDQELCLDGARGPFKLPLSRVREQGEAADRGQRQRKRSRGEVIGKRLRKHDREPEVLKW